MLRFGIIADVQYANISNRGSPERNYRGTLGVLADAVAYFNDSKEPLAFVAHLGDIIDDQNSRVDDGATTMGALGEVMRLFAQLRSPPVIDTQVKFLVGNHEMYNFSRSALRDGVDTQHGIFKCSDVSGRTYYSIQPELGWRVFVLDPYLESVYTLGRGGGLHEDFTQFICDHNHNVRAKMEQDGEEARRLGTIQCSYFDGVAGLARRFCPFNGGLGSTQLAWLRAELAAAATAGERVVLMCHTPFHPEATRAPAGNEDNCYGRTLTWDFEEVLALLRGPEGRCVVACFHGHQHEGGFHTDELGIHHIVFESPLFGPAYCIVELGHEWLTLRGRGLERLPSLVFPGSLPGVEARRCLQLRLQPLEQAGAEPMPDAAL